VSRLGLVLLVVLAVACARPRPAANVLRVGTTGDYTPFSVKVPSGWEGFDIRVAQQFAQETHRQLQFVEFTWPALEQDLATNRFDVAMAGVTMGPERARVGTFTRPVIRVGAMVLTWPGLATSARDLDVPGRRIGVNAGGHLEKVARRLFPRAKIVPVSDNRTLANQLNGNWVEAIVSDEIEAPIFQRVVPDAVTLGPLTQDRKAYLARDPALADELDAWLRAHETDASLGEARSWAFGPRWGAPHTAASSDLDALLALIDLRLACMPAIAVAKEVRGLPTEDAAQEDAVRAAARERAARLGLDAARIDALFVALIGAARDIQNDVRRTPPARRPPIDPMDLESEARPTLERISTRIVARAADLARGTLGGPRPTAGVIADALDASLTGPAERLAIADAVVALLPAQ
jgi:cyclohexadienyl dehydratase